MALLCCKAQLDTVTVVIVAAEHHLGTRHCELADAKCDTVDNAVFSALCKSLWRKLSAVYGVVFFMLAAVELLDDSQALVLYLRP